MIQSAVVRAPGVGAVTHEEARTAHNWIMIQSGGVRAPGAGAAAPAPRAGPVANGQPTALERELRSRCDALDRGQPEF